MKLQEAIDNAKDVIEHDACESYVRKHENLAKWLEELKTRRELDTKIIELFKECKDNFRYMHLHLDVDRIISEIKKIGEVKDDM